MGPQWLTVWHDFSEVPFWATSDRKCDAPKPGSVDYPSTRGIQVDVGLPDATSEIGQSLLCMGSST